MKENGAGMIKWFRRAMRERHGPRTGPIPHNYPTDVLGYDHAVGWAVTCADIAPGQATLASQKVVRERDEGYTRWRKTPLGPVPIGPKGRPRL
jgi:hypothetical protein